MQQGVLHKVFTSDGLDGNAHLLMDLVEYAFNMMEQPPDVAEPMGQYVTRRLENYAKAKHPELEHDTSFMESFLRWMNLVVGTHESCAHWDDVSTQTQYEELEAMTPCKHASLFSPPLPEKKVKAIDNLSIGVVDKIVLLFEEIWWPTDVICFAFLWRAQDLATVPEEDKWTTMVFGASISMANEKCLVFWTSGDEAKLVETLSDDVVKSKLMGLLRKFMAKNHVIPEPIDMVSNPYSRGSYSFDNVYTPDHPEVRADLAEPIYDQKGKLRLMFAGEATSKSHFSTVHGAIESGRREAHRFLKTDFNFVPTEAEE
ncbi:Spermine oxidase [Operophtera brumata]|uniref:Spermine oxidase n=1 Tax=Operophtera brumata TaxID=104452 RepID=A0A0L7LL86_OPEBR|nr:Spermine oxidase [Operophtera brumata]